MRPGSGILLAARALALTALAVGTAVWLLRLTVQRRALASLAGELAAASPGGLRDVLARSLGDDSVEVAYWSAALRRYVDDAGHQIERSSAPDRTSVSIERRR